MAIEYTEHYAINLKIIEIKNREEYKANTVLMWKQT